MSKEKTVYIDGDNLPYRIGFQTQRTIYTCDIEGEHTCSPFLITKYKRDVNKFLKLVPDMLVSTHEYLEEPMQAINTLKLALQGIVMGSKCNTFKVVLSGKDNFRNEIAPDDSEIWKDSKFVGYKANRKDFQKPAHWQMLREWLEDKPYTIISENEEADDVVSRAMVEGYVGASNDKDLDNTPGLHYNFNKGELYELTEAEAIRNFYRQCLTGDTADNIPGLKGIGPVKANKILGNSLVMGELEQSVLDAYAAVYDDPQEALTQVGRLLHMRRVKDEIWNPVTAG